MSSKKRARYQMDSRAGNDSNNSLLPFILSNTNNTAVNLPVEILHEIFFLCTKVSDNLNRDLVPRYPPIWVAITYVCHRWRVVALDFRKLWSTITSDLSPKWLVAFMQRSSSTPKYVDLHVGPPKNAYPTQPPLTTLPIEVTEEILFHVSRTENLNLMGNTADVIRTLKSLGRLTSLTSLCLDLWDDLDYSHVYIEDDDLHERDISLILPETLFSGSAPQLRHLHCHYALHVTFPPWVLRSISEFTTSYSLSPRLLFSALHQMPQLEVLRVSSEQEGWFEPHSEGVAMPVDLKNLTLLVIEGTVLEIFIAVLGCLSTPANVRRNMKFNLDEDDFEDDLWDRFSSLMREKTSASPYRLHGIHLRREPGSTTVSAWASPTEPGLGLAPSPWATSDDPFRLEICIIGSGCPHSPGIHTSNTVSSFHRLQQLCVSLGGPTVQELFLEYRKTSYSHNQPMILCRCWRSLFSYFPSLKTLRFGEGAEALLASASYAASGYPRGTADGRGFLFGSLQRVIVSQSTFNFSTKTLWRWIHYAFTRPPEWDVSDLRTDVEALLLAACWNSEVGLAEGVTESLLVFLLYCSRLDVQVFEVSFVESLWDNPGGLQILQLLLHILNPDWNVTLEATSLAKFR
ncbi:hypothetical protein BC827DRAFT_1243907 [Russula dissimulans]|nr:hypothetical protein BC827DRAFT_1243907 [Russula dissimulans]